MLVWLLAEQADSTVKCADRIQLCFKVIRFELQIVRSLAEHRAVPKTIMLELSIGDFRRS